MASALAFVATHGVVLASAKGAAPRLIEAVAGEPIAGNWWSHPRANHIYRVLSQASESEDVLVCRLVDGKITLVHKRLWPALVRLADRFAPERICQVRSEHTASGRHVAHEVAFPGWVPADVLQAAERTPDADDVRSLERWLESPHAPRKRARGG